MLSGSHNLILGGSFNQQTNETHVHGADGFENLKNAASPSAFHNSRARFDPPKCHPNTRLAVLEKITRWINGSDYPNASVMWVNGGAGVGKSAIAQTMAERLAEAERLVASFFFCQADQTRNNTNHLVPTIAYHTALHIPQLKQRITSAVERDPLIFNLSLDAQFSALLTEPILTLENSGYFELISPPPVIIIDGLDECEDSSAQVSVLNMISNALRRANIPLLFLIFSRPEQHLCMEFASEPLNGFHTCLVLDEAFYSIHDIRFYLQDRFEEVRKSHPLRAYIPSSWPDPDHIETLVSKSSGQFIYASTVIKYIFSRRNRPNHCLDVILGLRPRHRENPFSELDVLYTHIFSSIEAEDVDTVLDILAIEILLPNIPHWTVPEVEDFLSLKPGDIQIALSDFRSIVCIEKKPQGEYIKILHASVIDFLLDSSRSRDFHVKPLLRNAAFAQRYLELFKMPDRKLPSYWYHSLPEHCMGAALTWEFHQSILDFSLLTVRSNFYHGKQEEKRDDLILFMSKFLKAMESQGLVYHQVRKIFDEYLRVYMGNYYSNAPHTFLVALFGLRVHWDHWGVKTFSYSLKMEPDACYYGQLYDASDPLDEDNLQLTLSIDLSYSDTYSSYIQHLHEFLHDPIRSGACVLNGGRYAIAALHCLRFLCDYQSQGASTKPDLRETELRRSRPWFWRKIVAPNARELRKYERKCIKRKGVWGIKRVDNHFPDQTVQIEYRRSGVFRWALRCFRLLLSKSDHSKELLEFASQRSLALRSQLWPRQAKRTRYAIGKYISAWVDDID